MPNRAVVGRGSGPDPPGFAGASGLGSPLDAWPAVTGPVAPLRGYGWSPSGGREDLSRLQQWSTHRLVAHFTV